MGPAPFCAMHISVMMQGNSMFSRAPCCPNVSRSTGVEYIWMNFLNGTCCLQVWFARGSFAAALLCTYEIRHCVLSKHTQSRVNAYMWTLPDHPGASRKCSPTPALPGVRQNLPDSKIQKKKFFFFFKEFSRPSFLRICMVITVTCRWKAVNS